jgi:hypothetical protein
MSFHDSFKQNLTYPQVPPYKARFDRSSNIRIVTFKIQQIFNGFKQYKYRLKKQQNSIKIATKSVKKRPKRQKLENITYKSHHGNYETSLKLQLFWNQFKQSHCDSTLFTEN